MIAAAPRLANAMPKEMRANPAGRAAVCNRIMLTTQNVTTRPPTSADWTPRGLLGIRAFALVLLKYPD